MTLPSRHLGASVRADTTESKDLTPSPKDAAGWFRLGSDSQAQGKLAEARKHYEGALRLDPDFAEAHYRLGTILAEQGERDQAVWSYRQAVRLKADHYDALAALALALAAQGAVEEAVAHFRAALQVRPDSAQTYHNLGVALAQLGRPDEAAEVLRQALKYKPDYAAAFLNLGNVLFSQKKYPEAADAYRQAVRLNPDSFEGLNNLGFALSELGKAGEAAIFLQHAVRLRPQAVEAHNNLGLALAELGRFAEAEASFQEALRLAPRHVEAHDNLASTYRKQGRLEEAAACYDLALWLDPQSATTRWNRSLVLLQMGKFREGWAEYEWRWRRPKAPVFGGRQRAFGRPLWDGSPLGGRRLLIHMEQGLGDMFQFIRYVDLVKQRGATVIVEGPAVVLPVLCTCPGIDCSVAEGDPLPEFDVHCPLLSLPRLLETTPETIPAKVPYLFAEPQRIAHWRQRLEKLRGFKIGIAWQGNPHHRWDRFRSVALSQFAPLARLKGVQLVSLQKGRAAEQLRALPAGFAVAELGEGGEAGPGTFMDTAAIMSSLDLVITVDTAVCHLAGALGVPVWVALSTITDWRWLGQGEASPWYPTMRLFRQPELGGWQFIFTRMAREVRRLVKQSPNRGST